jgi:hypothetical protein
VTTRTSKILGSGHKDPLTILDFLERLQKNSVGNRQNIEDEGFVRLYRGFGLIPRDEMVRFAHVFVCSN